jgi:translation initiation factor eIF-2B subunit gamma
MHAMRRSQCCSANSNNKSNDFSSVSSHFPLNENRGKPGAKKPAAAPTAVDYIGLTDENKVVVFIAAADVEDEIEIDKSVLRMNPSLALSQNYSDAHFYIFSHWAMELLCSDEKRFAKLESLKGEFIPALLQCQADGTKYDAATPFQEQAMRYSVNHPDQLNNTVQCFAHIVESGLCCRVNTIESYKEANREISTFNARETYRPHEAAGKNNYVHKEAKIAQTTMVGPDCVVGHGTVIGEKASVKKSVIGQHCQIGDRVKINNSIVMDNVHLEDGVELNDSIVCNKVHVPEKTKLNETVLGEDE